MLDSHGQKSFTAGVCKYMTAEEVREEVSHPLNPHISAKADFLRRVRCVSNFKGRLHWVVGRSFRRKLAALLKKKGDAIAEFFGKVGHNSLALALILRNKGRRDAWASKFYDESPLTPLRDSHENEEFECPICCEVGKRKERHKLIECGHAMCHVCLARYLRIYMEEYTRSDLTCPCCEEIIHPSDVSVILKNWYEVKVVNGVERVKNTSLSAQEVIERSEKVEYTAMVRVLSSDPGMCWCPVPNCSYGVIVDRKEDCPRIVCQNPECGAEFCCLCRTKWHPSVSCEENMGRLPGMADGPLKLISHEVGLDGESVMLDKKDIKFCPTCRVPISKADDDGCNKIECLVCGSKFCWLCLKIVNNSHFMTPSGCTYLGKKPWGRRGKMMVRIMLLMTGPILAWFSALMSIPSTFLLTPICVYGRAAEWTKMKKRNKVISKMKVAGVTILAVAGAPLVSVGMAIFWFSATLTYIYVVMPISMIRGDSNGKKRP